MDQKIIAGILILVMVIIISIFLFLKSSDLELPPVISRPLTHQVSLESLNSLKSSLLTSENRISLRNPDTLSWNKGETGAFALGIRNVYGEKKTFYVTVFLEKESAQVEDWLVYPSKKTIPGGGIEVIDIVISPLNPPAETFLFRLVVCETPACSLDSPSLYATTTFSLRIL